MSVCVYLYIYEKRQNQNKCKRTPTIIIIKKKSNFFFLLADGLCFAICDSLPQQSMKLMKDILYLRKRKSFLFCYQVVAIYINVMA